MKRILASFLVTTLAFSGVTLFTAAPVAYSQNLKKNACSGANIDLSGEKGCDKDSDGNPANNQKTLNDLITQIINIFSIIVGVVAVIMIIYGGFRYIVSGGSQEQISGAKNTIIYALIGLVIVAFAQAIVRFVLAKATSEPS